MNQTIQHAPNLVVVTDSDAQPEPDSYTWFFHGRRTTLQARDDETSAALWARTLLAINEARVQMAQDRSTVLSPQALVTCYAGELTETSLAALDRKHMQEHILIRLATIGNSKSVRRGDAVAAVKAIQLMGQITGIIPAPKRRRTVPPTVRTGTL